MRHWSVANLSTCATSAHIYYGSFCLRVAGLFAVRFAKASPLWILLPSFECHNRGSGAQILPASAKLGNKFEELDDRGWKTKFHSRSSVYFDDYFFEHIVWNDVEVSSFWYVLAYEFIVIFDASFFPWRIWVSKEYLGFQPFCNQ